MSRVAKFTSEVVEGHKGVCVVRVPFDLASRAGGTAGRLRGERWGNFFIDVTGRAKPGETVAVSIQPEGDDAAGQGAQRARGVEWLSP